MECGFRLCTTQHTTLGISRTFENVILKAPSTADTHDAPRAALAHHVTLRQLEA